MIRASGSTVIGWAAVLWLGCSALPADASNCGFYNSRMVVCWWRSSTNTLTCAEQTVQIYLCAIYSDPFGGEAPSGESIPMLIPTLPPGVNLDFNGNGILDLWFRIADTSDPCAYNLDAGDRLGSNFGGPNTKIPGHTGVDIQLNYNDPIRSLKSGIVTKVGALNQDVSVGCGWGGGSLP